MSTAGRGSHKKQAQGRPVTNRQLLVAVPDMIFRVNRSGVLLDYIPAEGVEPYRTPDEFLGENISNMLPSDVVDGTMQLIEQVITTGQATTYTYHLHLDDGTHTYEARIVSLGEDEVLCIVRDLTARTKHYGLTHREVDVLRLVTAGLTDKEIAGRLGTSTLTVRKQVGSIRVKMGVSNRTEAAVMAIRDSLIR